MSPASTPRTPAALLDAALLRDPARPLITYYDDAGDERVELSVTTFANWVAKTANLLRDDLGADAGTTVALHLPAHWQAAVWLGACWALGAVAAPGAERADVAVVGPDQVGEPPAAAEVVVLGLGPLGLPRPGVPRPAPPSIDYDLEIRSHGDRFVAGRPVDPQAEAMRTAEGSLSGAALVDRAARAADDWHLTRGDRLLTTHTLDTAHAVLAGLLVPLAADVTAVLCRNLAPERLAARVASENVTAATGLPTSAMSGLRAI
ncbi:MAG TPA: TIGR03089 family protein [Actinomycetes bacterium]